MLKSVIPDFSTEIFSKIKLREATFNAIFFHFSFENKKNRLPHLDSDRLIETSSPTFYFPMKLLFSLHFQSLQNLKVVERFFKINHQV